MALQVIYNGAVAAGKEQAPAAVTLTAPFRGVTVFMEQTMAAVAPFGCRVAYATSIDGGATYSDWQPINHEPNPTVSGTSVNKTDILINEVADHIKFKIQNADGATACSTFLLQILQFA